MVLITMVLLLVVGGPVYFLVYQLDKNYGEFSVNMIETTTQAVYQSIFDGLMHNDSLEIQRNLEILSLGPGIQLVRIYNSTGKILYSSRHEEIHKNIFSLKDFVFIKPPFMGMKETFFKEGNTYSHHHPIYVQKECTPCHANLGDVIGVIDVHVWLTQSEQIYLSAKRLTILSAILIVVLLWLILNFLYHGQIESRLRVIINGFNELARGNLHFRIKMPGRHELAMLAQKFNQTIEKLKQAKEKEEHFIEERLERADRLITLGEVAAEIAHEVNNPASVILSRAEILRDEIKEKSSGSEYIEDLEIVIQQTERIAETTRSILHYARKLPHTFTETDLNQVIQRSIKILEPRIKKVRISIEFSPLATPARVWGNFTQLEQVFCNLLNNSLDVLSDGKGFIQIRIEKIDLVGYRPGYRVIFKDNGPGIPSENLDKVFSPFFTTKEEGKGTGLGLFIVRNIILHHRGRIYLDQNGEKGATFIIEMEALNATH